jgi:pimeloyl-ACP methyl ester carboxylesterase
MMRVATFLVLAATFLMPSNLFAQHDNKIVTRDHLVPHTSTVPANAGDIVQLFLRERFLGDENDLEPSEPLKAVLMVHGASVPVLPGMDLRHDDYSWAFRLARAGFDVFMLDFQGSGLSTRPAPMDDPCNANPTQQGSLIPNPLSATCPATYPAQLINSGSDWGELDTVVDYIRELRSKPGQPVDKVALVSWSQGAFRIGPYAIQHPDKVESVLFFAPIFNPVGRASAPGSRFGSPASLPVSSPPVQFSFPMTLTTKDGLESSWTRELQCDGQREDGIQEFVWSSIMDNDSLGRTWGPVLPDGSAEGVMRVRNPFLWGWNSTTVAFDGTLGGSVPVLIIYGELDTQVTTNMFSVPALYNAIPGNHKLLFKVACTGHFMVWESQRRVLHHISKQWLKHGAVEGFTTGSFFVDTEGTILPQ